MRSGSQGSPKGRRQASSNSFHYPRRHLPIADFRVPGQVGGQVVRRTETKTERFFLFEEADGEDGQPLAGQMGDKTSHARRRQYQPSLGRVHPFGSQTYHRQRCGAHEGQHPAHGQSPLHHLLRPGRHGGHESEAIHLGQTPKEPASGRSDRAAAQPIWIRPCRGHNPVHLGREGCDDGHADPPAAEAGAEVVVDRHQPPTPAIFQRGHLPKHAPRGDAACQLACILAEGARSAPQGIAQDAQSQVWRQTILRIDHGTPAKALGT